MAVVDTGRQPVWIFRARPYDLANEIERNVWFATTAIASDEPFEGWLSLNAVTEDNILVGDVLDHGAEDFAIAVRFRTDTNQSGPVLAGKGFVSSLATGISATGYMAGLGSGQVRAGCGDGSTTSVRTFSTTYADSQWHTLALWIDSSSGNRQSKLIYDDLVRQTITSAVASAASSADLRFGVGAGAVSGAFDGDIERVLHFEGTTPQAEIDAALASRDLTADAVAGLFPHLTGAWAINEGYGTRVQDVSGSGFHGTLDAAATTVKWSRIAPPPGTIPGLLSSPFRVSGSLLRGGKRLSSHALPSFGGVKLLNPDGEIDHLLGYSWSDRLVEQLLGLDGDLVTSYEVKWVGQAEQPSGAGRDELTVDIRGVEGAFEVDLQPRKFTPGYEPYVIFDGVDNIIDFGDNLNRIATTSFVFGCAFRATTAAVGFLYGKKNNLGAVAAGYSLDITAAGEVVARVSDGVDQVVAAGTFDTTDGLRHGVIGIVNRTNNTLELLYAATPGDWQSLGSSDISAVGDLSNAVALRAGAAGNGSIPFSGEIERVCQDGFAIGAGNVQGFLDERYPEDFDTSIFGVADHAVPLTENAGTLVGDLGSGSFSGTLSGDADPDKLWSGTPNGNRDVEGLPIPFLVGRVSLRRARWVDTQKLIFQVYDRVVMQEVFSVREGFVPIFEDTTTVGSIWTNAPDAGEWRQQGSAEGGNGGWFVRLGSQPTGTITFSADETNITANPLNAYPAQLFRSLANRVASSLVIGIPQLNAVAPYVSGEYWDEDISGGRAMDKVLVGAGAHWTVDPRNPFDLNGEIITTIFQARDVSAETPVATYRVDPVDQPSDGGFEGLRLLGVAPVYKSVTLRYLRYGEPLSLSEPRAVGPSLPVPFENVIEMTREWRHIVRPEPPGGVVSFPPVPTTEAILAAFAGAEDFEIETATWLRSAAVTEAERLVLLHNRLNRIYEGKLTAGLFARWIGDIVDLVSTRLLGDGTSEVTMRFLVVGVTDDADESGTVLELWGGFEV